MRVMKVRRVALDQQNSPVVLLVDEEESIALPIWIGHAEATSIAMRLQGFQPPRPMTHDLLQSVVEQLAAKVTRIVVTEVRDSTYYAEIHLAKNGTALVIDSRPSDAIALALRAEAPIFVEDKVASQAIALKKGGEGDDRTNVLSEELDPQEFRRFLESVKPSDFERGKGTIH